MKSMNVWARSRTALSMAALLALAACGGGGGSSTSGSTPSTVSVAGIASKGLLRNAVVTAYAVTNGIKGAALGSTTTDADGRYTLTGLPSGALVLLEVTPKADGSTTMLDEATDVVVPLPGGSDFKLRTAVNLEGSETSAQITPFTHMAVALAESNGGLTPNVVAAANNTVANFAGMPILTAAPSFAQEGVEAVASNPAAVTLAAVSELAKSGVGSCTGSGSSTDPDVVLASVSCVTTYLASEGPASQAVTTALNTALTAAKADASTSVNAEEILAVAPVTYVETGVQTAIQEARSLISSVRATVETLSSQSDASLASRVRAIEEASYGVAQPLDDGTLSALRAVSDAITEHQNGAQSSFALDDDVSYSWPFYGQQASGCSYFEDGAFETESATRTQYLGCKVAQTAGYDGTEMFVVYHLVGLTDLGDNQFTVQSKLARAPVQYQYNPVTYVSTYQVGTPVALGSSQTMTVTATESTLLADGLFAPGVELSSSFNSSTQSWSDEVVPLGTHQDLDISLSKATVGASTRLSMNGDVRVYDGTAIQSRFSIKPGSFVEGGGDEVVPRAATLILEAQLKTGYKFGGTLTMSDYVQSTARTGPTKGTLTGSFTDMAGAELFNGALALVMPTDDGLNWDATLDGTLVTTGTSTLTVKLTAKQSATVQDDFTVTGRYTQGGNTFFVTVVSSEATLANNQVTFETPSGVGFVLNPKDPAVTSVDVKKGATVLGTYDRASSKLVYADGTYEQF